MLFYHPSFPLLAIAPDPDGKAQTFKPDFVIWRDGKIARVIEAKGRVAKDYQLRAQAFEAVYGVPVEIRTESRGRRRRRR